MKKTSSTEINAYVSKTSTTHMTFLMERELIKHIIKLNISNLKSHRRNNRTSLQFKS